MCYSPQNLFVPVSEPASPPLIWEETGCLLCQGRQWQTLVEAPDTQGGTGLFFAVVQCQDCGLCFTNPRPKPACLERFYPKDYRPHQVAEEQQPSRRWKPPLPMIGEGRLLDFGCGGGTFLRRMREHGWRATGLDISAETVERLRGLNLDVLQGTLPHPELAPGSFDLVTMWHSLEHVPDPRHTLVEARRLLAPGGKLLVAVPNIDSLAFRIFGSCWFGLDLPRHLTHFAPWTLHFLLERTGYRVERIRMTRRSAWLRHSARLAARHEQATLLQRIFRSKLISRLAAFYSCLTNQSDCMMALAAAE
jgi:2-polyprenyl-3-methyl-5-hydroxy-6-metoxy-1,4-benzoquinol methylase